VWMWINPRTFRRTESMDNRASRGVSGQRVWLNRDVTPVPQRHRIAPHVLNGVTAIGTAFGVWGLITSCLAHLAGLGADLLRPALVFDRMVWLYEDVIAQNAHYRSWFG
jgi:hypothetical protein